MMKAADVRQKSDDELTEQLIDLRKEAFNLRFQRASGQPIFSFQNLMLEKKVV